MARAVTIVFADDGVAARFAAAAGADQDPDVIAVRLEGGPSWGAAEYRAAEKIDAGQEVEPHFGTGLVRRRRPGGLLLGAAVTGAACNEPVWVDRAGTEGT